MRKMIVLRIIAATTVGCLPYVSDAAGILQPGDTIYAIDLDVGTLSDSPANEAAAYVLDGDSNTKYLNFGNNWSGFIVTPASGSAVVQSIRFTTANDADGRDPAYYALYGTADPITSASQGPGLSESWTLVSSGPLTLPTARFDATTVVNVGGGSAYTSYKLLFPATRGNDSLMQIADVQFYESVDGSGLGLLNVGDPIVPVDQTGRDGSSRNPTAEGPANLLDGNTATKYLNFGDVNSGFVVAPQFGPSVVGGFQLWTANDSPERDPAGFSLFGMNGSLDPLLLNSTGDGPWTLIASGSIDLPTDRLAPGGVVNFSNDQSYDAYRFIATSLRDTGAANSMQFSDFELYLIPEPSGLALLGLGGLLLARALRCRRK